MGHHVNINLLNVFVNTSTEALRKRSKPTPAYESALAEAERVTERLNMEFEGRLAQQVCYILTKLASVTFYAI